MCGASRGVHTTGLVRIRIFFWLNHREHRAHRGNFHHEEHKGHEVQVALVCDAPLSGLRALCVLCGVNPSSFSSCPSWCLRACNPAWIAFLMMGLSSFIARGIYREPALTTGCARKGPWRMSRVYWVHLALPDTYFADLGLQFPWTDPA